MNKNKTEYIIFPGILKIVFQYAQTWVQLQCKMENKLTSVLGLGSAIQLFVNLHLLHFSLLCLFQLKIIQGKEESSFQCYCNHWPISAVQPKKKKNCK